MVRSLRAWGLAVGLGACLLFLAVLWPVIVSLPPEMDLWWNIPVALHLAEGRSGWGLLTYFLQPAPALFSWPVTKLFPWLFMKWLHWPFSSMIGISVLGHIANAGLIFWTGHQMGFSRRSSAVSALLFMTMFIHFHAYLWPMAAQLHVLALLCILSALGLYLRTERAMECGEPCRGFLYGLTLLVGFSGSLIWGTFLVLLFVVTDLVASSRSGEERIIRYDRWMPLFLLHPFYAVVQLSLVGDRITTLAIAESGWPPSARIAAVYSMIVACVVAGRWLLRIRFRPWLMVAAIGVGFLFLFPLRDRRQVLFVYNALVPFASVVASFLDPIGTALRMDSAMQYYVIPARVSGFALALTVLCLVFFWRLFVRSQPRFWILLVWYAVCLAFVFLHPHVGSAFPLQLVSRYFIYFTPVVAWIVPGVLFALLGASGGPSPGRRTARRLVLGGLLLALCGANLAAIRVAVFRGKFFNTYGIYDDLRIAGLIAEDLSASAVSLRGAGVEVAVNAVVPLEYYGGLERFFPPGGIPFGNFRIVASDALRSLPVRALHVNDPPATPPETRLYRVAGVRLEDGQGNPVDPFTAHLQRGLEELGEGREAEAGRSFEQAAAIRPFLLRYLLDSCRLEDARWITQGSGLREWLEEVIARYQAEQSVAARKQEQTVAVVRAELADYGFCLLQLANLNHRRGQEGAGRERLLQLRLLEPDPEFLVEWLRADPRVRAEPGMQQFLEQLGDPPTFPGSSKREGRALGPFLRRLLIP